MSMAMACVSRIFTLPSVDNVDDTVEFRADSELRRCAVRALMATCDTNPQGLQ